MTVTHKKYKNDFQFIHQPSYNKLPITTLYLFCDVGSVYEYDKMRGASHFIEHMCFRGSKKIPQSQKLLSEFSKIGAYFNAYTTKRYTCYTIKCQDVYVEHCLQLLADMLFHSLFKESDFHKEEKVIIEESNKSNNDPYYVINNTMERMLYQGSSYEYSIDSLDYHHSRNLTYKNVVDFYHRYYTPNNMFLSVVTNLSTKQLNIMLYKSYFTSNFQKTKDATKIIQHSIRTNGKIAIHLIEKKGITNAHICIGFRICGKKSPDKYCFQLLSIILGNPLSGRFMMVLREKKGLIYNTDIGTNFYEYTGDISFYTVTSQQNLMTFKGKKGVMEYITQIFHDLIQHGITEDELEFAKGFFKGSSMEEMQDNMNIARYNGEEYLTTKKVLPYDKIFEKHIKPITLEEINEVIREYFILENMCVCLLGEKLPSMKNVQKICENI